MVTYQKNISHRDLSDFTHEVHEVFNLLETWNTLQTVFTTQVLVCSSARYKLILYKRETGREEKKEIKKKKEVVSYPLCCYRKSSYFKHIFQ